MSKAELSDLVANQLKKLNLPWSERDCTCDSYYNDLLISSPPPYSDAKRCSNEIVEDGSPDMDVWMYGTSNLGVLEAVTLYCRWRGIRVCTRAICKTLSVSLNTKAPHCSTWPGFRDWVVQVAACMCSYIQVGPSHEEDEPVRFVAGEVDLIFNTLLQKKSMYSENQRWLESVDLVEVFNLIEWVSALHGAGRDPRIVPPPREYLDLNNKRILEAIDRTREVGLCPRRIGGILANMPRGALDLPALIPRDAAKLVSPHRGHLDCTMEFCHESVMTSTNVRQLHVCPRGLDGNPTCHLTSDPIPPFPEDQLCEAAVNRIPTAWAFDGKSIVKPGEPYMAISHVWSDGTGNGRGEFNRCLYNRFCGIAKDLGCVGIWWDNICLPKEHNARVAALNDMQLYYQTANVTLLHDLYVQEYRWDESNEKNHEAACFAIIMSTWWTRAWTALELLMSSKMKVLFADLVVKDLDSDVLTKAGFPASRSRLLITSIIRNLRRTEGNQRLDKILQILRPRYVSMPRDKGIITSILARVPLPTVPTSRQNLYLNSLKDLRILTADNLFHGKETMKEPFFSWCPVDLLEIPVTRTPDASGHLRIYRESGDEYVLLGTWDVCSPRYLKENAIIIWKGVPMPIEAKLREALSESSINEHVLLCEWIQQYPRAILVKPMIWEGEKFDTIGAEWVGSIEFDWKDHSNGWGPREDGTTNRRLGKYSVGIGATSSMYHIGPGMAAYDYLRGLRPTETVSRVGAGELDHTSLEAVPSGPMNWWQYSRG